VKIISKYKDFYDYLQGVWGQDEKIVLDRTHFDPIRDDCHRWDKVTIRIGDLVIQGVFIDGKFRYGPDLEKYSDPKFNRTWIYRDNSEEIYYIPVSKEFNYKAIYGYHKVFKSPIKLNEDVSISDSDIKQVKEMKGAVAALIRNQMFQYPPLNHLNINSALSPEEVWILISNYLSQEKTIVDSRTNRQKIEGHGFDFKTSFRKM